VLSQQRKGSKTKATLFKKKVWGGGLLASYCTLTTMVNQPQLIKILESA